MKEINNITIGALGEKYTSAYLKKMGYKILEMNLRNSYSEIDIIAENKEYIIFVEVKTRTSKNDIRPVFAVGKQKQKKIMLAANEYLKINKSKKQPRFDISEVYLNTENSKKYEINYIINAYTQGGAYAVF